MKTNKNGIRLNRFISMCGICSRRKADQLILEGRVKIKNKEIATLGTKIFSDDIVLVDGNQIYIEKKKYILLNKPRGYITTMHDEKGRKTVLDLIKGASQERIFPVGRLDQETTGLLLFTNDGLLAKRLTHPKHEIKKTYHVTLNKKLKQHHLLKIKGGLILDDGIAFVDDIDYLDTYKKIKIELHIGRNRIVRRIFESFNYQVLELDRVDYAGFNKKNLSLGQWRALKASEIKKLNRKN